MLTGPLGDRTLPPPITAISRVLNLMMTNCADPCKLLVPERDRRSIVA